MQVVPTPGDHKTDQPSILAYDEVIGCTEVTWDQAEQAERDLDMFDGYKVQIISTGMEGSLELRLPLNPRAD